MSSREKQPRHWLDDPLTDRGLFVVGAGIQLWSTLHMFELAHWAFGSGLSALACVLMYDVIGLITARVGADERNGTRRMPDGVAVRGLAWTITTFCFGFTLVGNLVSHWIFENGVLIDPVLDQHKPLVRVVLGSLPVLLLLATLVLRTRMKAYKDRVVRREQRQAEQDRAMVDAQRRLAEQQARAEQAAREEADRRHQEAMALAAAQQAEAEREAAEARRVVAEAAPAVPARAVAAAASPRPRHVRATASPDNPGEQTKTERADRFILDEWACDRTPTGKDVDEAVEATPGSGLGRQRLRAMRKRYPNAEPGGGTAVDGTGTATGTNGHAVPELVATAGQR